MATIGTFTASDNGYTGSIKTLTLNIKAKFVASEKDNDKALDRGLEDTFPASDPVSATSPTKPGNPN